VGFGTEILFTLMLGLLVLGPKRLGAMAGTWPELKPNSRMHCLPSGSIRVITCFRLSFASVLRRGGLLMKTPCYGLVALTLVALTIFAPTTVAHAQACSVLYDFGTRVGDPRNPSWPGVVAVE
jgi:hypothetical protein